MSFAETVSTERSACRLMLYRMKICASRWTATNWLVQTDWEPAMPTEKSQVVFVCLYRVSPVSFLMQNASQMRHLHWCEHLCTLFIIQMGPLPLHSVNPMISEQLIIYAPIMSLTRSLECIVFVPFAAVLPTNIFIWNSMHCYAGHFNCCPIILLLVTIVFPIRSRVRLH